MRKPADALLILTPEERSAAQKFVEQRLRNLDAGQFAQLQALILMARQQIRRLQVEKENYRSNPSHPSQVMVKLYDSALSGLANLVLESNRASGAKQQKIKNLERENTSNQEGVGKEDKKSAREEIEALLLPCTSEEEEHATSYVRQKLNDLQAPELKRCRIVCRELLTWWESDRGQMEGLALNQYGNVNTATGRTAIRQKRGEFEKQAFAPLKAFFQDLNIHYQKTNRELADQARQDEIKQEVGEDAAADEASASE